MKRIYLFFKFCFYLFTLIALSLLGLILYLYQEFSKDLPKLDSLRDYSPPVVSEVERRQPAIHVPMGRVGRKRAARGAFRIHQRLRLIEDLRPRVGALELQAVAQSFEQAHLQ